MMNNLNNRPVTHVAPLQKLQQAVSKTAFLQRSRNFLARIGKCYSIPNPALSQASTSEDMSAASSRPRVDHILETNTGSWKKVLDEWINSGRWSDIQERSHRKLAGERISACIRENRESLELHGLKLSSLPPVLHYCKALRKLSCGKNKLTQLNLEGCKALDTLYCSDNQLIQLNLKGCNGLKRLYCNKNKLTQLNLEGCKALKMLYCHYNQLTQLNIEGCNAIQNLCFRNNDQLRFDHLDFLLSMRNLRHIECSNTAIEWDQLPEGIRNNQAIFIDIRPQQERHQAINNAQNTHVQSIHRCASQNAKTLKSKHSTQNLKQAYLKFCEWINQLPTDGAAIIDGYANNHFKNLTAKEWIAAPQYLEHRDETSGVSVKEFLALAWLAAKDPARREPQVSEAAALEALVNALYEIRRGYNLDDAHNPKDNGQSAYNICAGGTFNKISEKLVSVIQGTASFMVTSKTFQLSLTSTIKKAIEALRKDNPVVDDELKENGNLLTAPVWEKIKTGVIASIKEEFKNYPKIAGKDLDQHIREQTDYEQVLQYFSVSSIQNNMP